MQKNLIVQVRVYKGQVNFDEKGNVTSPNQLMKLRYGIREWDLFLKGIVQMGWTRVDVVKCLDGNERIEEDGIINHPEVKVPETIEAEIKKAMEGEEKVLTPDQQKIKDLEGKIEKILNSKQDSSKKIESVDRYLESARKKYEEVFGKKPHHKSSTEKLNEAIQDKLNESGGE